jgi:hypothetical protein
MLLSGIVAATLMLGLGAVCAADSPVARTVVYSLRRRQRRRRAAQPKTGMRALADGR